MKKRVMFFRIVFFLTKFSTAFTFTKVVTCNVTADVKELTCDDHCMMLGEIPNKSGSLKKANMEFRKIDNFKYHKNGTVTWTYDNQQKTNLTLDVYFKATNNKMTDPAICCNIPIHQQRCSIKKLRGEGKLYYSLQYNGERIGNKASWIPVSPRVDKPSCLPINNETSEVICLIGGIFYVLNDSFVDTSRVNYWKDRLDKAKICIFNLSKSDIFSNGKKLPENDLFSSVFMRDVWEVTEYYKKRNPNKTECVETKVTLEQNITLNATSGQYQCYQSLLEKVQYLCMPNTARGKTYKPPPKITTVLELQVIYILVSFGSIIIAALLIISGLRLASKAKGFAESVKALPVMVELDNNLQPGSGILGSPYNEKEQFHPLIMARVDPNEKWDNSFKDNQQSNHSSGVEDSYSLDSELLSIEEGCYLGKGSFSPSSGISTSGYGGDLSVTTVSSYKESQETQPDGTKFANLQVNDSSSDNGNSSSSNLNTGHHSSTSIETTNSDDASSSQFDSAIGSANPDLGVPELSLSPGDFPEPGTERLLFETLFANKLNLPGKVT